MSLQKPEVETSAASTRLKLPVVPGTYAVCRQDPGSSIPEWFVPGPLASLTYTEDGISIFAMSTYDTDYILVQEKTLSRAIDVLSVSFVFGDYR